MENEKPRWKANKLEYIKQYTNTHYHRITIQLSFTEAEDVELWDAIKAAGKSKNRALKELAKLGLKHKKNTAD